MTPALSLSECIKQVEKCSWYWGAITHQDCRKLLKDEAVGTFLVRDSESDNYIFTVVYQTEEGIKHSRIPRHNGKFCLGGPHALIQEASFVRFIDVMISCSTNPQSGRTILTRPDPNLSSQGVSLVTPLSRFRKVPALMYLARLVIRENLRDWRDANDLPLPEGMKKYVMDSKYLLVHYPKWERPK